DAMRLARLVGPEGAGDTQREHTLFGLFAQSVELGTLSGVVADPHRVDRDAAFGLTPVGAHDSEPAAIADGRQHPAEQQSPIGETVDSVGNEPTDPISYIVATRNDLRA